ncbi:hypothetical protein SARC_14954, partial [Sphaeroforma arctica JP610]
MTANYFVYLPGSLTVPESYLVLNGTSGVPSEAHASTPHILTDDGISILTPSHAPTHEDVIRAIPIVVFSFTCHHNVFTVYKELNQPTDKRIGQ